MAQAKCLNCMEEFDNTGSSVCPHCGYDQDSPKKENYHLDPGTFLNERYLIGTTIGAGGFGITYIAWDTVLDKKVAIKEYFPTEFCTRMAGESEVCPYDGEKTYQFEAGLNSFVDEALRLAKLNSLPNIVHIYDSFVYNYTAYIIMEYVDGKTLMQLLKENGPLPYEQVIEYMIPVLDVLEKVHQENMVHRDIAPDNIKVNHNGEVVLLDFGSARNATTHNSKSLSVLVKPGYSPWEQYRSQGNQGPWTDVYAIGAVMYHLITGKLPQDCSERIVKDELKTPTELGYPIPENVENTIMNALNVKQEYRLQSAKEFADALRGEIQMERVVDTTKDKTNVKLSKKTKIGILIAAIVAAVVMIVIIVTSTSVNNLSQINRGELPSYIGMNLDSVSGELEEIEKRGVQIKYITVIDTNLEDGRTITKVQTKPEGESSLGNIEQLTLTVTMPPIHVPKVTGLSKKKATEQLMKAGIAKSKIKFKTKKNNDASDNEVLSQSIKAGKQIEDLETVITLTLAKNYTTTTQATTQYSTTSSYYYNDNNNTAETTGSYEEFTMAEEQQKQLER